MLLKEILKDVAVSGTYNGDIEIRDIIYDSRNAVPDTIFVCMVGFQKDGHKYVMEAYEKGVRVFAVEKKVEVPEDAVVLNVESTRKFLALASANFFGRPAEKLFTIGVTGTKGKTSTCYMMKSIFEAYGKKVGIMGNIGIIYDDTVVQLNNNTPESYDIHKHLKGMVDAGCDIMIMEASSQGLMTDRTYGIMYDVGLFTNLSPDHIGAFEHKDFDEYLTSKKKLFSQCKHGFANIDNKHFGKMTEGVPCPITTFAMNSDADFRAVNPVFTTGDNCLQTEFTCIEKTPDGEEKTLIDINIPGYFTIYNAIGAIAATRKYGVPYLAIKEGLKNTFVKGRMEIVPIYKNYTVIIDYAHNEVSVQSLFETIKIYKPKRIISVFGCGGNRSKLRRAPMGEIIAKNSDISIVTSDNSRFERVEDIVKDILVGVQRTNNEYVVIYDRKEAIHHAIDIAKKGDVILLIGKGHEDYEDIEGEKRPFSERQIVLDYIEAKRLQEN
jgi:UDP-N-acetylmuramoyl-L-alanyl-D-glutamate--2,6-diaminopimelate ligase